MALVVAGSVWILSDRNKNIRMYMKKNFMMVALLGVTAGASLSAADQNQVSQNAANSHNLAWQRKSAEEVRRDDESSFASKLSPYTYNYWRDFSADQRKKSMDYADKNKMSPDSAVEKVQMEMKK